MDALDTLVDQLPPPPERWMFPGRHDVPVDSAEAASLMSGLDSVDREVVVLVYGLGRDLGAVSAILRIDPAIVSWRLHRVISPAGADDDAASREVGLAKLLHEGGEWNAARLVRQFPGEVRTRLLANLTHNPEQVAALERRAGMGPGVIGLVALGVAGVMLYGAIRDVNPLWRGAYLMRNGLFEEARRVYSDLLRYDESPEAKVRILMCWLAEGRFDEAETVLEDPDVVQYLGFFRPVDSPPPPLDVDPDCGALLPRGRVLAYRPDFVFEAGPAGDLVLVILPPGGSPEKIRTQQWPLASTVGARERIQTQPYPDDWPALLPGPALWGVPGSIEHKAPFTVLESKERSEIIDRCNLFLPHDYPEPARRYLRGHFYLRQGLYQEAAGQFAWLVERFPREAHPRQLLRSVARVMRLDVSLFLNEE